VAGSAASKARGPGAAARRAPARGRGRSAARIAFGRWWKVALLVLLVTVGLPLAHALFGEVVALLGSAMLLGFLLGRWTAG
jgi:hypothetical protein